MGEFITGGSGTRIKSKQRGTLSYPGALTTDITISAVDITKAKVEISFIGNFGGNTDAISVVPVLLNSTTLRLIRVDAATATSQINWEITEYYNLKSKQSGTHTQVNFFAEDSVAVTSVDISKSELISYMLIGVGSGNAQELFGASRINTATQLRFYGDNSANQVHYWQLLEFY